MGSLSISIRIPKHFHFLDLYNFNIEIYFDVRHLMPLVKKEIYISIYERIHITVDINSYEKVKTFKYLGSLSTQDPAYIHSVGQWSLKILIMEH